MEDIISHGWIFMVFVTTLNGFLSRKRVTTRIENNPHLSEGYQNLFIGYLFFGNAPWLIMGIGIESGQANLLDYLRPSDMNTAVLIWFATMLLSLLIGCYWVFVRHGAEFLSKHSGFIVYKAGINKVDDVSPTHVKFQFAFLLVFGVIFFSLLWFKVLPIPSNF